MTRVAKKLYLIRLGLLNYLHILVQIECEMKIQFHELSSHVYTHFKRIKKAFINDCVLMSWTNNKFLLSHPNSHSSSSSYDVELLSLKMTMASHLFNIECLLFIVVGEVLSRVYYDVEIWIRWWHGGSDDHHRHHMWTAMISERILFFVRNGRSLRFHLPSRGQSHHVRRDADSFLGRWAGESYHRDVAFFASSPFDIRN